jgi:hypothetical protein
MAVETATATTQKRKTKKEEKGKIRHDQLDRGAESWPMLASSAVCGEAAV